MEGGFFFTFDFTFSFSLIIFLAGPDERMRVAFWAGGV